MVNNKIPGDNGIAVESIDPSVEEIIPSSEKTPLVSHFGKNESESALEENYSASKKLTDTSCGNSPGSSKNITNGETSFASQIHIDCEDVPLEEIDKKASSQFSKCSSQKSYENEPNQIFCKSAEFDSPHFDTSACSIPSPETLRRINATNLDYTTPLQNSSQSSTEASTHHSSNVSPNYFRTVELLKLMLPAESVATGSGLSCPSPTLSFNKKETAEETTSVMAMQSPISSKTPNLTYKTLDNFRNPAHQSSSSSTYASCSPYLLQELHKASPKNVELEAMQSPTFSSISSNRSNGRKEPNGKRRLSSAGEESCSTKKSRDEMTTESSHDDASSESSQSTSSKYSEDSDEKNMCIYKIPPKLNTNFDDEDSRTPDSRDWEADALEAAEAAEYDDD